MSAKMQVLIAFGVVLVPTGIYFLGCWLYDRRQETSCRRRLHEWGVWRHVSFQVGTAMGLVDVVACECRTCGHRVRRLLPAGERLRADDDAAAELALRETQP